MDIKSIIISSILFLFGTIGFAQSAFDISLLFYQDSTKKMERFPGESLKVDSLQLGKVINQRMHLLYELGYLGATNSLNYQSDRKVEVCFFTNQVFKMIHLSQGNISEEIMNKVGFDPGDYNNRPFFLNTFTCYNDS